MVFCGVARATPRKGEEMSDLSDAIAKARGDSGDSVPAGVRFLNEMSRRLTGVHEHTCCDCGVGFDCIETDPALCDVACVKCRERNGLE